MENLSPSLPEKSFHGNCFAGKTISDDVFGGPPKFGVPILSPRVEDYTEIFEGFHASRGSSIPILNLPAVDDEAADLSFDFRGSKFDYSEVFGCFNALDFAVSYEGLFKQTNGGDDSSFEAWTPAQSESLSDESDPCACFEKNQTLSSGDLPPLFDGTKKFNILYHMANPRGKEDMLNGMTNVTQPDAVPGYSFTLDESTPAQKMEDEKLHLHLNLNSDFGGKVTEGEKTVALHPNSSFGIQEYANEPRPSSRHGKASPPWKAFISVSDISLRTQPSHLPPPSRPPPTFADIKGNFSSVNSKLKASKSYTFERMEADSLPAYFDVEIDASSSSAASAVAMKNAEEKAQAQLRSAKELMECKEGLQSHTKLHLETDIEHKGEKTNKFDIFNSFKDEGMQTTCEREGNDTEPCVAERRKNVRNTTQIVSGATDGEGLIHVAVKSALNDHGKEHSSSRGSHKTEGSVAQREVTQFHEVVETKKLKDENTVAQQSKSHDRGQKEKGTGEALERQEYTRSIKEASADPEWEETGEQLDMLKVAKGLNRQKEHQEKANVVQKVHECQEKEKKTRMTLLLGETEKILYELHKCEDVEILTIEQLKENEMVSEQYLIGINEREEYEKIVKEAHDSKENGREIKESFFSEEYEREFKEDVDLVENKGKLKEALELGTEEKQEKECRELEEIEKKQVKTHEIGENKKKTEAAVESDGKTKWSKEVFEQEGNVNRLKVDLKQQENNKEQKGACEAEQNEKSSEKNAEWEENAKKQEKAYDGQESEPRLTDDCESEKNEKRLKEAWEQEEIEKRLQEVDESGDSDKRVEQHFKEKDTKDRSKDASLREDYENRIRDDTNCEGFCRQGSVHVQNKGEENNRKLKLHQGIYVIMEEQKASDGACNLSETKIPQATGVAGHDKIREKLETQKAPIREENERLRTEPKNCKREIEAVEGKNVPIKERVKSSGMDQNDLLPGKTNNGMEDAKESLCLHDSVAKSSEDGISIGGIHIEKSNGVSEITSHTENANILTRKESESRKNIKRIQFAFGQGENKDKFMSSQVVKEWVEHERKFSDVLPAQKFASQIPGKKEMNLNEKLTVEEREKDEKLKRERTLENDCLRRTEEEREREREREKDRMAVDTTTREAPESAFSEGKDRAERAAVKRATVEVRQRALVEARERLEKASAGVRERLTAEKASMEARLKVERAAVDKATTKARERAFEKAMAEKASFEAREQVERSVADKSSAYSRNRGLRQTSSSSDLQYQSVGSYHDLKYSHSSVHGGLEGESDQRCKARLERHQRTAERAAKALAEKNMRDLLAHKEQVERNRLAETLDVEVKRWSSGKEGNLRALLSTLQYILGPDNGWQPIPPTDVITDVAIKKAYRKATLCVHPDKLQQRGSSIQQKYICEKVFDLLKEAWNKFNSEGR